MARILLWYVQHGSMLKKSKLDPPPFHTPPVTQSCKLLHDPNGTSLNATFGLIGVTARRHHNALPSIGNVTDRRSGNHVSENKSRTVPAHPSNTTNSFGNACPPMFWQYKIVMRMYGANGSLLASNMLDRHECPTYAPSEIVRLGIPLRKRLAQQMLNLRQA